MSVRLPQISSAQCKRARAMLKWNPQDLASRGRVQVKRVEMFERNQLRLTRGENDEIVKLFQKYHIDFRPGNKVVFMSNAPRSARIDSGPVASSGPVEHTVITTEATLADGVTKKEISRQSHWDINTARPSEPKE